MAHTLHLPPTPHPRTSFWLGGAEFSVVNCMYQTSLTQFNELYELSIDRSERAGAPSKRIHNIIEHLTYEVTRAGGTGSSCLALGGGAIVAWCSDRSVAAGWIAASGHNKMHASCYRAPSKLTNCAISVPWLNLHKAIWQP